MLGWIYIWKDEVGNFYRVKVKFGNLWFYLLIHSTTFSEDHILRDRRIIENTCSVQEKWKNLGESEYKDYRNLSLYELARIIFIKAPDEERAKREAEWKSLGSYYRRGLPKKIDLNVY